MGRLLGGRGQVVGGAPVVQRVSYGLDRQASQDKYVDDAVKLWTKQPGMSLKNFANALLKVIGVELKGYGVPFFGWTFVSDAGAAGLFDSKAWKVQVNVSKFSDRTTPKTLKDLTVAEVTDVVGTLYHESRHTDQDVLIIRVQLDQQKTEDQIFADTKIRRDVIKAVAASKYGDPLDADQIAHAKRMFDVMYGAHKELLEFLMRHSAAFEALDSLAAPASKVSAAATHIKTFGTWQSAVLQPKLKQMSAAKNLTAAEKALLQRLQAIDTSLTNLVAGWKKVAGVKTPPQADVDDLRDLAADARDAISDAYVKLEGEEDAFRVEGAVKRAFAAKVAKP
ncbi:hypothetical protein EV138_6455 [Kribbella voronezhensis]|uniref:Uncharacterized protein n=1 Tax=Kribbella voronezhensis TaxID=2512212 RepID=A0A4R7SX96_9ACTN|nr:hypothetical protein [Kribbella voronezhensis]TDU83990.1 hypothetical protein EV138_6455 [Kribbella voronezhensis]